MTSLILQNASKFLQPLMLLVSVFLLLRGHNEPGGGFAGGLVAAASFGLHIMAFGVKAARESLWVDPRSLVGLGLLVSVLTALLPLFLQKPFFTPLWFDVELDSLTSVHLGTPLLFDMGVYLVVCGAALSFLVALEEE